MTANPGLITDLSMPGMDGLALIRGAQARMPGLPAILLTGYAGDGASVAVGGAVTGPFMLLRKPTRATELGDQIHTMLAVGSNRD
jgi:FixJ family two-component response regulator